MRCLHGQRPVGLNHTEPACVIVETPDGCHCYKDSVQALCAEHYRKLVESGFTHRVICLLQEDGNVDIAATVYAKLNLRT